MYKVVMAQNPWLILQFLVAKFMTHAFKYLPQENLGTHEFGLVGLTNIIEFWFAKHRVCPYHFFCIIDSDTEKCIT